MKRPELTYSRLLSFPRGKASGRVVGQEPGPLESHGVADVRCTASVYPVTTFQLRARRNILSLAPVDANQKKPPPPVSRIFTDESVTLSPASKDRVHDC